MFDHALVPTDGSELSQRAVNVAIEFARKTGALMTALFVTSEPVFSHPIGFGVDGEASIVTPDKIAKEAQRQAQEILDPVAQAARQAGVRCNTLSVHGESPYQTIIDTATAHGCDLIIMASHGRGGIGAMLLGSETQKVLTHTKIPVLVIR